jgi:hypothetical protein
MNHPEEALFDGLQHGSLGAAPSKIEARMSSDIHGIEHNASAPPHTPAEATFSCKDFQEATTASKPHDSLKF